MRAEDERGHACTRSHHALDLCSELHQGSITFLSHPERSCGIQVGGALYCWGSNPAGQLGIGNTTSMPRPTLIASGETWASLPDRGFSSGHTCAIHTNGSLFCWVRLSPCGGRGAWRAAMPRAALSHWVLQPTGYYNPQGPNASGQLGIGSTTPQTRPALVAGGRTWMRVSIGPAHTAAIASNGSLWLFGSASAYAGNSPVQAFPGVSWIDVGAGSAATCAIQYDTSLWCFVSCFCLWRGGSQLRRKDRDAHLPVIPL